MLCTFQVHKNIDLESDRLYNHSTLFTMLFGTAYKNVISYIRLSLSHPLFPRKKAFHYFQIRRKNISESMKKASRATLIHFCHL